MTLKRDNKAIQTEPFRLSAQETRAIWALSQSEKKPCSTYGASNLVELGFAKQVNLPKKDNSHTINEVWKDLQKAVDARSLRVVNIYADKISRLLHEENAVIKGYVLTPLGKQVARGIAVKLSSQFCNYSAEERKENKTMNFTVDGAQKTVGTVPATGKQLYAAAGNPATLKSNGTFVPNNDQPFSVSEGQAFTTK
jgi:hypothetical protein